jgi:hypothetical protein
VIIAMDPAYVYPGGQALIVLSQYVWVLPLVLVMELVCPLLRLRSVTVMLDRMEIIVRPI